MKIIKFVLASILLLTSACNDSNNANLYSAIDGVINSIRHRDKMTFNNFFANEALKATDEDLEYYFGKTKKIFTASKMRFILFESNGIDKYVDGPKVIIVFYNSSTIDPPKSVDWKKLENHWLKNILVLEMQKIDGEWKFIQTPFYFFRHTPWSDDYG